MDPVIVINGKFYGQKLTGVQRFAREAVARLDLLCEGMRVELVVPEAARPSLPEFRNLRVIVKGKKASTLWEQTTFARYVRKVKGISLDLCNSAPLFGRKIVCIHDVKFRAYPRFFTWKFAMWYRVLFRNITKRAQAILTVSEFSKKEIEKYYPKSVGKICVVGNGWQHFERVEPDGNALQKFGLDRGGYFFAMSSLEPNKNLNWIVQVAKKNPREVFAVAGGINRSVFADSKIDCPPNVKLLGYITDGEAKALMGACRAFLFVSFYEGFGLPPLEAYAAGAPCVVATDSDVMHEVLGNDAVFVSPERYDYDLNSLVKRCETSCLGKYSWDKSAEKILAILKESLHSAN